MDARRAVELLALHVIGIWAAAFGMTVARDEGTVSRSGPTVPAGDYPDFVLTNP